MFRNKKVAVVMPAYNAEKTLRTAYEEVKAQGIVDVVVIVDDCSSDATEAVARELVLSAECGVRSPVPRTPPSALSTQPSALRTSLSTQPSALRTSLSTQHSALRTSLRTLYHRHEHNLGYGGNQKNCYDLALKENADIIVMVHPDCQYTPKLLVPMVAMIAEGLHPCVLASRILGGYALKGGMPIWKYISNRFLTAAMNILFGSKLSEFHTGYRAFSADLVRRLPLERNSDDFVFDAQMLSEILETGATIGEVSCPTVYNDEASSINFRRSCTYGLGCLATALRFRLRHPTGVRG